MEQLAPDLWTVDTPLRFGGLQVGARMTIARLPNSKLFLHSPVDASKALVQEVQELGEVSYLIAPNKLHHLFVGDWQKACPEAKVYAAPGLKKKRRDLAIDHVLGDEPDPGWSETLDQIFVLGFPFAHEVVFFHRPSATLILTDLAFNVGHHSPPLTRFVFKLMRAYGRVTPTLLEKLMVRDRPSFRQSLEQILEWPFERVVMAHGAISETGGRDELVRGYSWVLGRERG